MSESVSELNKAMRMLAAQPGAIFIGQGVAADGVATFDSLDGIDMSQRIETPVVEELQIGMGIGMSLMGFLPILIYPRCDFLLRAMDQLVLHLDKMDRMSAGQFVPKVIIRTKVGKKSPLDAGPQHTNDFSEAFKLMFSTVFVERIDKAEDIMTAYKNALDRQSSTIVVETV